MLTYNTLLILIGTALIGACSGLIGVFAVLRQRSLTADALAHATLPGLCIALVVSGQRSQGVLMIGATLASLLAVWLMAWLARHTKTKPDAVIGIVLSVFFGAGVALNRMIQSSSATGKAGLGSFLFGKASGMLREDVILISIVTLVCVGLVLVLYKELMGLTFQGEYLQSQGWPIYWLDTLMMALLATTVVVSLPIVGVVLSSALIIIPATTALLWTNRFSTVLLLSSLIGALSGISGSILSAYSETPTGAVIILVAGLLFVVSFLVAPGKGLWSVWLSGHRQHQSLMVHQLLLALHAAGGHSHARGLSPTRRSVAREASRLGYLRIKPDGSGELTPSGQSRALELSQRLDLAHALLDRHPLSEIDYFELMTSHTYADELAGSVPGLAREDAT